MEKFSIMILDDNRLFCELLEYAINKTEDMYCLAICHDPFEGLEMIKTKLPDVLILDNILSYLDGIGVLEKINEMALIKRPKILMVSSLASDNVIRSADRLGADYFLNRESPMQLVLDRCRMLLSDYLTTPTVIPTDEEYNKKPEPIVDTPSFISNLLHKLGFPANLKGYEYLRRAILISLDDSTALSGITKVIYPKIAREYKTDASNVERAIRHSVEVAWKRCDTRVFMEVFRPIMDKKKLRPTNSEVISTLTQYVLTYGIPS